MPKKSASLTKEHLPAGLVKAPPYSREAEQSVLGGLMLDNKAWDKIADKITEHDFYLQEHCLIFRALQHLAAQNKPFDALTLAEALRHLTILEAAGGDIYLYELVNNTPSVANIVAYAEIVHEKSILRRLIAISQEIANSAFEPSGKKASEILDDAERKIFELAERGLRSTGPIRISQLLTLAQERIETLYHAETPITGIATEFIDLDETTAGLQAGDLIIVAGRPSMGKTAFAMNMAEQISIRTPKPVLVFSMEMPGESLAMRILSSMGRIDQQRLRTGKLIAEDWSRITSTYNVLANSLLFVDDTPALSPVELRARARRLYREYGGLSLVVIDYLQLMQSPGHRENRTMEISEISRSLKSLAKELNVPIIALSQLNRSLEQRGDKRPMMSDLRESGAIEQDADLIIFIYRDEVYNPNSPDKGSAEIIIAKQRNGPIGKIRLTFLGQYTRFENYAAQGNQVVVYGEHS